jgi:hypothetical protein
MRAACDSRSRWGRSQTNVGRYADESLAAILAVDIVGFSRLTDADARSRASLATRAPDRSECDAACQDEPIAAPFLNSQDAPRPRDRISGRYLLGTIATVNHRDAVPYILDAIVSEQGPRVVGSGCFIRGGRFRPCHKR